MTDATQTKKEMTHISSKYYSYYKVNKPVILHTLIGAAVFYFIIHPLTMAMYWFEFHENHQVNLSVADNYHQKMASCFFISHDRYVSRFSFNGSSYRIRLRVLLQEYAEKKQLGTEAGTFSQSKY
jgi:hypothetical protein